jgi:hypothetical protein
LWESFWKRFIANRLGGGGLLPFAAAIDHCRTNFYWAGISVPALELLVGAPQKSQSRIFQDLRAGRHDRKQESSGGNPPSGHEKPELSSLVLFTPGNNMHRQIPSGEETYAENQSWKCACN